MPTTLSFSRLAAVALVFSACALAGCGRKGGLDAPPSASAVPTAAETQQDTAARSPYSAQGAPASPADAGTLGGSLFNSASSGGVVAPRGPKKRIILDPILD